MLPGYYSMQAVAPPGSLVPDITRYHRQADGAMAWKKRAAKLGVYRNFLLRSAENRWHVYNAEGAPVDKVSSVTGPAGVINECVQHVSVDVDRFVAGAQSVLGVGYRCLTWAAHHSFGSSAGHSNLAVLTRHMITEASDNDMRHIFLVDSVADGCRVAGWFADVGKLSPAIGDLYLDRFKWLEAGWPLANDHHLQVLAWRIATLRPLDLVHLLHSAAEALGGFIESDVHVALRVQTMPTPARIDLTMKVLDGMEDAILITGPGDVETFDDALVALHAERIAKVYERFV